MAFHLIVIRSMHSCRGHNGRSAGRSPPRPYRAGTTAPPPPPPSPPHQAAILHSCELRNALSKDSLELLELYTTSCPPDDHSLRQSSIAESRAEIGESAQRVCKGRAEGLLRACSEA